MTNKTIYGKARVKTEGKLRAKSWTERRAKKDEPAGFMSHSETAGKVKIENKDNSFIVYASKISLIQKVLHRPDGGEHTLDS